MLSVDILLTIVFSYICARPIVFSYICVRMRTRQIITSGGSIFFSYHNMVKVTSLCLQSEGPRWLGNLQIWRTAASGIFLILLGIHCVQSVDAEPHEDWLNHGDGLLNHRSASCEHKISTKSASQLSLKWSFTTGDEITATPAISDGVVYFPSWNGNLYAVLQDTGELVWQKNLTVLTGTPPSFAYSTVVARATPTIYGDFLLIGTQFQCIQLAINKTTGDLLWQRILDPFPYAEITMSGQAFEGFYYIGSSSFEEARTTGVCCAFQGAFFKLNIISGEVVWKTPMLPDNGGKAGGYSGAALWGSTPPIDVKKRAVYIATGNTYTTPPNITACELAQQNLTHRPTPDPCLEYNNHQESVLSISIDTGVINWATKLGAYDTWIVVCLSVGPSAPNCPPIPGPDADFGEAPMLLTIPDPKGGTKARKNILVVGQKNGFVWGLDAKNGSIIWGTAAGPGGTLGGASWGMATDGELVFTNLINNGNLNFTLVPSNQVVNTGGWVALEAATGRIVWSQANPFVAETIPPVTHANGVLLAGSASLVGEVVALDAKTGNVLWTSQTNGTVNGGFSVADGCGFVGIGVTYIQSQPLGPGPPTFSNGTALNVYCVDRE